MSADDTKVFLVEALIVGHEVDSTGEVVTLLEDAKYLDPTVLSVREASVAWDDNLDINYTSKQWSACASLFEGVAPIYGKCLSIPEEPDPLPPPSSGSSGAGVMVAKDHFIRYPSNIIEVVGTAPSECSILFENGAKSSVASSAASGSSARWPDEKNEEDEELIECPDGLYREATVARVLERALIDIENAERSGLGLTPAQLLNGLRGRVSEVIDSERKKERANG